MKKNLLFTVAALICFCCPAKSQIAYHDAIPLKEIFSKPFNDDSFAEAGQILIKYLPVAKGVTMTSDAIRNAFLKNPFMPKAYLSYSPSAKGTPATGGVNKIVSALGGLDVAKYANAISDIMIERAKQELTVAFFNRFEKFSEMNPEFKLLFPKTTGNLKGLLSYTYPQMLPALRIGFFEDIKQVSYQIDDVMLLPKYQALLANFPEVRVTIKSLRMVQELETGASNAADIINQFATFDEWGDNAATPTTWKSVGSTFRIAAFFSESIMSETPVKSGQIWVKAEDLKKIFYDKLLYETYMGLMYQMAITKKINYIDAQGNNTNVSTLLAKHQTNSFLFQTKLKEFFDLTGKVNVAFEDLRNKISANAKPSTNDIFNYVSNSIDAIDYSFNIIEALSGQQPATDYLPLIKSANSLYKNIHTEHYTTSINDVLDIFITLNKLLARPIDIVALVNQPSIVREVMAKNAHVIALVNGKGSLKKITTTDIENVLKLGAKDADLQKLGNYYSIKSSIEFIEKVKPYALFMANMAEAKDDKEVKAALENVILPVGSAGIKKNTEGNISVQSYLGAYVGSNSNNGLSSSWKDRFGVSAPIGISWTLGCLSNPKGGALSLFTSLLDLGAIVDYKLKKEPDVTSADPNATVIQKDYEVKLGQIFSPGAYAVWGLPWDLPIALGLGTQYGPGLSKVEANNNIVVNNPSWRANFFISVDMPLFTLKNAVKYK